MFAALFGTVIVQLNIVILILLTIVFLVLVLGLKYQRRDTLKYSLMLMVSMLGLFGIFRCQDKKDFCYLGLRLNGSKLAIALLLELGIVIFAAHIGITMLLAQMGVTAMYTLVTPILSYFIYPAVLSCLRKKCS